jgi:hypothetical protein
LALFVLALETSAGKEGAMAIHVEFVMQDGYMSINFSGMVTSWEEVAEYTDQVKQKCLQMQVCRILADIRQVQSQWDVWDRFEFGKMTAFLSSQISNFRVAVIILPSQEYHRFVETVARNRAVDYQIFTDEELALKWLLR